MEKNNYKLTIKFCKLSWILNQQRSLSLWIMGTGRRSFAILLSEPSKIFKLDIYFDNHMFWLIKKSYHEISTFSILTIFK